MRLDVGVTNDEGERVSGRAAGQLSLGLENGSGPIILGAVLGIVDDVGTVEKRAVDGNRVAIGVKRHLSAVEIGAEDVVEGSVDPLGILLRTEDEHEAQAVVALRQVERDGQPVLQNRICAASEKPLAPEPGTQDAEFRLSFWGLPDTLQAPEAGAEWRGERRT